MKIVELSQQDRAIIRACIQSTAIGKATLTDLKDSLAAMDVVKLDELPKNVDLLQMDAKIFGYEMEEAHYKALKAAVDGDGKANLSRLVMRQYVACVEHLEVAKDAPKE